MGIFQVGQLQEEVNTIFNVKKGTVPDTRMFNPSVSVLIKLSIRG
jgi:hypothetical protein